MHCNYGQVFKLSSNNSELFQVCKLLLDKNAFVNSKTKLGWTALHFAASKVTICFFCSCEEKKMKQLFALQGYTDLVEFLIKSGGSIGLPKKSWMDK